MTFTQNPPKSQPLREGDDLDLTCSVQGKPDPTSVTLSRRRTSEMLENVQTTELTYTIDPISCLETGVYICSGQNSQGTTTESISVEVLCEYQGCCLYTQHTNHNIQTYRDKERNIVCLFHKSKHVGHNTNIRIIYPPLFLSTC